MLIGYARISKEEQTLDLQLDALREAGCTDIYHEIVSGARQDRPELTYALRACHEGDTLIVWRLDRLGRDTKHLIAIVEDLDKRQVGIRTLTGNAIDTTSASGKLIFQIFAALAEYERALIQERVRAGLVAARARGRLGGRPPKLSPEQQHYAVLLARDGTTITAIAQRLHCSRHTVRKTLPPASPPQPHTDGAAEAAD